MLCGIPLGTAVIFWFKGHLSLWTVVMVFLTDRNLGTGVDKKKAKQRRRGGPKSLAEQGYFIHDSVCLYIVIQGSFRQKNKVE